MIHPSSNQHYATDLGLGLHLVADLCNSLAGSILLIGYTHGVIVSKASFSFPLDKPWWFLLYPPVTTVPFTLLSCNWSTNVGIHLDSLPSIRKRSPCCYHRPGNDPSWNSYCLAWCPISETSCLYFPVVIRSINGIFCQITGSLYSDSWANELWSGRSLYPLPDISYIHWANTVPLAVSA